MNRTDIAIVVNTCPKYFYLLEAHFGLLRRYAESCHWPVYLATEEYDNPLIETISRRYSVNILRLKKQDSDFLESRVAAVNLLPSDIQYVLPIQEDFLLERQIDIAALTKGLEILDVDKEVQSLRLMPCPGSSAKEGFWGEWCKLLPEDMIFSYQATIWRRDLYSRFLQSLIQQGHSLYPELTGADWNRYCISTNPAETHSGLYLLRLMQRDAVHLCWPRKGVWANAVYWCPWPYRPTAVVKGVLQPWAIELIRREGFQLKQMN